jgi:hypothetical protein
MDKPIASYSVRDIVTPLIIVVVVILIIMFFWGVSSGNSLGNVSGSSAMNPRKLIPNMAGGLNN